MERMRVSVVIVNYNSGDNLTKCVQAVLAQTYPPAEILVVDNASTDGSQAGLPGIVRLIQMDENLGLTKARNIGIRAARSPHVMTLDDDIYPTPDCLEKLVGFYREHPGAVLCPSVVYDQTGILQAQSATVHFVGTLVLKNKGLGIESGYTEPVKSAGFIGACIFVKRDFMLVDGKFEELFFFYFEDMELSLRLMSFGIPIFLIPEAIVSHEPGQGTAGLSFRGQGAYPARRVFNNLRNRWVTILLHYQLRTLFLLFPALLMYEIATLAICVWRGWRGIWLRAMQDVLLNRKEIIRKRASYRLLRKVNDGSVLSGGPLPFSSGFIVSPIEQAMVRFLEILINFNWYLVKSFLQ